MPPLLRRRLLQSAASGLAALSLLSMASLAAQPAQSAQAVQSKRLRIGVTLHPYYSYVANIVGDKAEVVPLIPAGFNPHAYEPRAEDIQRIGTLDVAVLNGIGHDDFADRMIAASSKPKLPVIEANAQVPLLAAVGAASRGTDASGKVVNPHTFLSVAASIAQVNTIARELGKLDAANAEVYRANARAYGQRLRKLRADALANLAQAPGRSLRVATVHGAYDYLLREFGLEVTAVVEPAHGIEPSPAQLKATIDQLRSLDVKVIFSEMDFPSAYVDTIQRETGVRLYALTHISYGAYTKEKFEQDTARTTVARLRAIREAGQ
jgi:zinc transport system substrate-binding protein